MDDTTFRISDTAQIIMNFSLNKEHISGKYLAYYESEADIVLMHNGERIALLVENDWVTWEQFVYSLESSLKKALNNELPLHSSITNDIGFCFNHYRSLLYANRAPEDFKEFVFCGEGNDQSWVGNEHRLWKGNVWRKNGNPYAGFDAWMYNDAHGLITLEITPRGDYDILSDAVLYAEWIKNYRPYLKAVLSPETARQWLAQIDIIFDALRDLHLDYYW